MADRFFKKTNGIIIQLQSHHDVKSLEDRFVECDKSGKEIKKEKKVSKKKAGK